MWGAPDIAQDGTAEMNALAVLEQATGDGSPSCDNRRTLTRDYILTKLRALNLIIMLKRGVEPMKGRQVWKKRHGNMLKPSYNLKSTNTCQPTCYLFLPELSSSDLEMRKGSNDFYKKEQRVVWNRVCCRKAMFLCSIISTPLGGAPWTPWISEKHTGSAS